MSIKNLMHKIAKFNNSMSSDSKSKENKINTLSDSAVEVSKKLTKNSDGNVNIEKEIIALKEKGYSSAETVKSLSYFEDISLVLSHLEHEKIEKDDSTIYQFNDKTALKEVILSDNKTVYVVDKQGMSQKTSNETSINDDILEEFINELSVPEAESTPTLLVKKEVSKENNSPILKKTKPKKSSSFVMR